MLFFRSDSPSVYNLLNSGRYIIIFFHEFSYRLRLNDFWLWSPPPAPCVIKCILIGFSVNLKWFFSKNIKCKMQRYYIWRKSIRKKFWQFIQDFLNISQIKTPFWPSPLTKRGYWPHHHHHTQDMSVELISKSLFLFPTDQ